VSGGGLGVVPAELSRLTGAAVGDVEDDHDRCAVYRAALRHCGTAALRHCSTAACGLPAGGRAGRVRGQAAHRLRGVLRQRA